MRGKPRVKRETLVPPVLSSAGRVGCLNFDVVGDRLLLYFREAVIVMIRRF